MLLDAFLYKYNEQTNMSDVIIVDTQFTNMVSFMCPDRYLAVPLAITKLYRQKKIKPLDNLKLYYTGNNYHYKKCESEVSFDTRCDAKLDYNIFNESDTKYKVRFKPLARDIRYWAEDDSNFDEIYNMGMVARNNITNCKKDRKNIIPIAKLNQINIIII